ncbi:MAG: carboxypeptidase regulatory-like domain-containing protein [Bacteroidetes bacterium]|nr:carboxypeptidase regulatory-like domain-containing protein [Bacteroidota bacterium]
MKKMFTVCIVITALLCLAFPAVAGEITGKVVYSDGSACSGCKVQASISRGGVTDHVRTDDKGYFRLTWSSDNWISKLFVNGSTVRKNIRPGAYLEIRMK